MLSQFWPVVLDSGYIFFISLLMALEEFHISLRGLADSDPEVCLSLFVAMLVVQRQWHTFYWFAVLVHLALCYVPDAGRK